MFAVTWIRQRFWNQSQLVYADGQYWAIWLTMLSLKNMRNISSKVYQLAPEQMVFGRRLPSLLGPGNFSGAGCHEISTTYAPKRPDSSKFYFDTSAGCVCFLGDFYYVFELILPRCSECPVGGPHEITWRNLFPPKFQWCVSSSSFFFK